ncbi:putative integrase core domain protein, partial [Trichinella spiralis]|uniref:putative integrase core domain protein n=1 Tax=Trichinella spiralis TaxID=6334 RepID=UPI0001EFC790
NAELPSHMKHPVILPGDHALTMGLIKRCHARQLHAGTTHTLAILRQQYWVLKGRTQVKKVIRHCFACRRAMARPIQPKMAALPSSRVVEAAAFAHTGMDFAGPLLIRVGKRATSKCYVCLFTCMASRAVHLELVPQMTTARVMQALRRFIARRGRPEIIQSDNFRSFKAAASELRQLWRHVDVDRVQRELVGHRIHWKFITERAPWMGGYWERLVRSIKESLRKILGKALLDEEELRTTLCEVEASLNARPLTFVGDEDHERHPLSPFQLLTGRAYVDFPAVEAHDPEWQPVGRGPPQWSDRWRYRQQLLAKWWRSWRREYLSELMQRQKWRSSPAGPEVNDLVLILEDNIPRVQCPIGVITELHFGSDGIARSARIRTSNNVITRPVAKLVQLEPATVSDGHKDVLEALLKEWWSLVKEVSMTRIEAATILNEEEVGDASQQKPQLKEDSPPKSDNDILQLNCFGTKLRHVHLREELINITKLHYLRSCLSGPALKAIEDQARIRESDNATRTKATLKKDKPEYEKRESELWFRTALDPCNMDRSVSSVAGII